jgi:hypothetical protein
MIIICLILLNIFCIDSTYTPYNSIKKYNLRGENKTTTIYTPYNSLKLYSLRDNNKTITINKSLFYDFICFHYLK